jgi:hypothetical protein
MIGAKIE